MKLELVATHGAGPRWIAVLCVMALSFALWLPATGCASEGASPAPAEQPAADGQIEPRYQPREPKPEPFYNSDLLFGMTRAVTNSTIHPGAQVPLLVLTIPLDIAFLPFAAIGGFF